MDPQQLTLFKRNGKKYIMGGQHLDGSSGNNQDIVEIPDSDDNEDKEQNNFDYRPWEQPNLEFYPESYHHFLDLNAQQESVTNKTKRKQPKKLKKQTQLDSSMPSGSHQIPIDKPKFRLPQFRKATCKACSIEFQQEAEFHQHVKDVHQIPCDRCKKVFANKEELAGHKAIRHPDPKAESSEDDDDSKYEPIIIKDEKTGEKTRQCRICSKEVKTAKGFKTHLMFVHKYYG